MQVTHERRQLFHTWLAEGTAGRGGNGGRGEGKKTAMELESVLKSFTTQAGYKCNSLKRLGVLMFVWFSLYNLSKETFIILGFFSAF